MDFEIPENVAGLSDEDLQAAIESAYGAGADLAAIDDADITDEQIASMTQIAEFIRAAEGEQDGRTAAAAERAAKIAEARAAVARPEVPAEDDEEPEAEPSAEVDPEEPEGAEEEPEALAVEPAVEEVVNEPVAIAASAAPTRRKKNAVARTPQAAADPIIAATERPTITAAANTPSLAAGQRLESLADLVPSAVQRFASMTKGPAFALDDPRRPADTHFNLASIAKQNPFNTDAYRGRIQEMLDEVANESRLPGNSLTAAGGWCSPSETVYDLCGPLASSDGIIDIPEVTINRGGINFTKGIDWGEIFSDLGSVGFIQTEAQAEAGEVKVCNVVDCPEWVDHRLDAVGLCIKHGILTESAFPELLQNFMEGILLAHQARIGNVTLDRMLTIAGPAQSVNDVWPNALSLLHALELLLAGYRQQYRMAFNSTLEVVLPHWVRPALRADLANRTGVELTNVTDAVLDSHFSNRNLRVQWVYGWQDLNLTGTAPNQVATTYPDTLEALVYPAGTFVKGVSDVIRLDAIYSPPDLNTNTYTALFIEEGLLVMNRCYDARRISFDLNVTGRTAAADIVQAWGTATP